MAKRLGISTWTRSFERQMAVLTRHGIRAGSRAMKRALKPAVEKRLPPPGAGDWIAGVAMGTTGLRRFRLYRPPGVRSGERLPLMVMLHGCGQDAKTFAMSTRMNAIAARERFFVLYPEQDRLANPQGCWNWFDTSSGRAQGEAGLILKAIDQVCLLHGADRDRIAIAGLSAGASMAALLVSRHPERFKAVVMHSGIPPGTAHSAASAIGAMVGHRGTRPLPATAAATSVLPPLMVIHGNVDAVVSASNGRAAALAWADAAGARPMKSRTVQRGKRYPMTVTDFRLKADTVATLVEVDRLGHAWSGGAARHAHGDRRGPDASRMAWTFASKQFAA